MLSQLGRRRAGIQSRPTEAPQNVRPVEEPVLLKISTPLAPHPARVPLPVVRRPVWAARGAVCAVQMPGAQGRARPRPGHAPVARRGGA